MSPPIPLNTLVIKPLNGVDEVTSATATKPAAMAYSAMAHHCVSRQKSQTERLIVQPFLGAFQSACIIKLSTQKAVEDTSGAA
jgi:hypothetical protein